MLALESPLEAYRNDLERNPGQDEFGSADTLWLLLAHCTGRVSRADVDLRVELGTVCANALREFCRSDQTDLLRDEVVGPNLTLVIDGLSEVSSRHGSDALARGVRGFASQMSDAGALSTAFTLLAYARQVTTAACDRERGLLAADQARVARQLGDLEGADDLYEIAATIAERSSDGALAARVSVGRGVVARVRGNYPRAREFFADALTKAENARADDIRMMAHQGLTITAAVAQNYDEALYHGWCAFQLARGDVAREGEALSHLAQLALEAGYPRAALRGFIAAMGRSSALRVLLPQLGGAAVSAARAGEKQLLARVAEEAGRALVISALPYENAQVNLSLARAFGLVGDIAKSEEYRAVARRIAKARGFFEVMHALQPEQFDQYVRTEVPAAELAPASAQVVESLSVFEVERDVSELALTR